MVIPASGGPACNPMRWLAYSIALSGAEAQQDRSRRLRQPSFGYD
ncbi:MAG: hypothetical protein ACK443_10895 [Methylococcaceae bacterium]